MNNQIVFPASAKRSKLIYVVDADLQTCETLSLVFRLEGFETTFATSIPNAVTMMQRRRPDLVVANFAVGDENGLSLLRHIKTQHVGVPVFMIADVAGVDAAVTAMKFGATDVFTKPVDHELLLQGMLDALRRDVQFGAMHGGTRSVEVRGFSQITAREREVLQLLVNGHSNKETGLQLKISPRTVEVHRARVMEKLGARNTADLMRIVLSS